MNKLPSNNSNSNYYPQALLQFMLYQDNLQETAIILKEIQYLKNQIFSRQKKHRRCDKEIVKQYKCQQCSKVYASEVALKLHWKLKHKPPGDDGSTDGINQNQHCSSNQIQFPSKNIIQ